MIVCLDTNVVWRLLGSKGACLPILRAMMAGELALAVSNEILLEYEEVLTRKFGPKAWGRFTVILDGMGELYDSVRHTDPHFHFHVITADPDDNMPEKPGGARRAGARKAATSMRGTP